MQRWSSIVVLMAVCALSAVAAPTSEPVASTNADADADECKDTVAAAAADGDLATPACDDFHERACGNWRAPAELRLLHARDTLTALRADNQRLLLQQLEQPEQADPHERAAAAFYGACVARTQLGADDLAEYLRADGVDGAAGWLGGTGVASWERLSAQLRRYGVQTFWRLHVAPNWQAAEQHVLYLAPPSATQPLAARTEEALFLRERYIKNLMLDLGQRVRRAQQIAARVLAFEGQLLALVSADRANVLHEPVPLEQLARELGAQLQLHSYFRTLLGAEALDGALVVADAEHLRQVAALVRATPADTLGQYLLVQLLAHFEVRLRDDDSYQRLRTHCLQQTVDFLPRETGALFVRLTHAGGPSAQRQRYAHLQDLFAALKLQFERRLNATDVFERDAGARVLALEKLRAMRLLLPPADALPPAANSTPSASYERQLLELSRRRTVQQLALVLPATPPAAVPPAYGPLDVNAYYHLQRNAVELPLGLLRARICGTCRTPAQLHGALGYMLAHELLHGFDYHGIHFDGAGNVVPADSTPAPAPGAGSNATRSWSAKALIRFGMKSSCYLSARYKDTAPLAVNENIADSEGLRLALDTYVQAMADSRPPRAQELREFFLSFAQLWCGSNVASSSQHIEHKERVNTAVGNFAQFADAYGCDRDSAMNPPDKCHIW